MDKEPPVKKTRRPRKPKPPKIVQDQVIEGAEAQFIPKRNRKNNYEPWMCEAIIEVAEQGGHVAQMCQAIGIASKDTFYRWIRDNKDFETAYEEAKTLSQAFYENLLLAGACGKVRNFNFSALAMILNNKFPTDYKRNATGSNTEINIGSINSIEHLDDKALDIKIAKLQQKLQLVTGPVEDTDNE